MRHRGTPSAIPPTAPRWRLLGRLATAVRPRRRPGVGHAELLAPRRWPVSRACVWPLRCSSCTRLPTGSSATAWGRVASARAPTARCSTPAPRQPTGWMRRSRSSTRCAALSPACCGSSTSVLPPEQALEVGEALQATGVVPGWLEREEHRRDAGARDARRSGGARPRSRYRFQSEVGESAASIESRT
jgi:hypothetical protein